MSAGVAARLGELGLPAPASELATRDWDVVVVGAGHNGLTAAAYLGRAGRSVLVLERRGRVGGACTLERPFADQRYVVSPCAYVAGLLDPLVIGELGLRERGVRIHVADPALFIPFDDGTAFVEWSDEERTVAGLRDLGVSAADIRGYLDYIERFDRCRRLLRKGARDAWVGDSPSRDEVEELLGGEPELIDLVFRASIADVLDDCVSDQRIKDALYGQGLIAAYGGPRTSGTAAIHLMHHMGELDGHPGAWGYVEGGMGMISFAIAEVALEAGATIACGVPVGAIRPGTGVELEDGTAIRARSVVCNADPKVALRLLDGEAPPEYERRLREWRVRSPVVKVNAALAELPRWTAAEGATWPAAGTVNCRESLDDAQAAFEACERGELRIAFCEIYSQSASEAERGARRRGPAVVEAAVSEAERGARRRGPAVVEAAVSEAERGARRRGPAVVSERAPAPADRHVISAFCQYSPADAPAEVWDAGLREESARQVFDLIERFAPGTRDAVLELEVLAPPDVEERIGLSGGCIFQGECFPDQMWDRRLSARTPVEGLYLCGAATHPGGSVIGLNGRNAAMALLADRASTAPPAG